jgi:hypothetical protein
VAGAQTDRAEEHQLHVVPGDEHLPGGADRCLSTAIRKWLCTDLGDDDALRWCSGVRV